MVVGMGNRHTHKYKQTQPQSHTDTHTPIQPKILSKWSLRGLLRDLRGPPVARSICLLVTETGAAIMFAAPGGGGPPWE